MLGFISLDETFYEHHGTSLWYIEAFESIASIFFLPKTFGTLTHPNGRLMSKIVIVISRIFCNNSTQTRTTVLGMFKGLVKITSAMAR